MVIIWLVMTLRVLFWKIFGKERFVLFFLLVFLSSVTNVKLFSNVAAI